jgi:hypothetical protein
MMRPFLKSIPVLVVVLVVALPICSQQREPITKTGLITALKDRGLSSAKVVAQVKRRGVSFQLKPPDENEIRRAGRYLGKKKLDDLVAAVRDNYHAIDWRRSDEAKQLASQMASDVQKLEDEGRLIDLTDYQRATKVYVAWVEKCSVTLGRIDNQMRKFRLETTYRYYFEKNERDMRGLLSDENLSRVIQVAVLSLQAVEKALAFDTSPDRDPNYPSLLNPNV